MALTANFFKKAPVDFQHITGVLVFFIDMLVKVVMAPMLLDHVHKNQCQKIR